MSDDPKLLEIDPAAWIGRDVIIKTVGEILVGRLLAVSPQELLLHPCAWIADTGRWHQALSEGSLSEVEPYLDPVCVGRGTIVARTFWRHGVPTEVR